MMCQLVIFGSLILIWKFDLNFEAKRFWKFRIDNALIKFLATTENQKLILSEDRNQNWGKIDKIQAQIKLLFAILLKSTSRVELTCSRQRASQSPRRTTIAGRKKNLNWAGRRVNFLV